MRSASGHQRTSLSQAFTSIVTVVSLAVCMFLFSLTAFAQSTTEGAVGGTVYDPHGAVVANATVVAHNNGTNAEQTATTNSSGYFRITGLAPATYTVTMTASGFAGYKAESVVVELGRVTELSPKLGVAGTTQQVDVSGEAPEVNTTS